MDKISDRELYERATKARENAYAPYSGFRVGAALLTDDGRVFTGVNVENSSYGRTICAERVAFTKAISEGVRAFEAIAVSAGEEQALPCGICRQFMSEFNGNIRIITGTSGDRLQVTTLEELMPQTFALDSKNSGGRK